MLSGLALFSLSSSAPGACCGCSLVPAFRSPVPAFPYLYVSRSLPFSGFYLSPVFIFLSFYVSRSLRFPVSIFPSFFVSRSLRSPSLCFPVCTFPVLFLNRSEPSLKQGSVGRTLSTPRPGGRGVGWILA